MRLARVLIRHLVPRRRSGPKDEDDDEDDGRHDVESPPHVVGPERAASGLAPSSRPRQAPTSSAGPSSSSSSPPRSGPGLHSGIAEASPPKTATRPPALSSRLRLPRRPWVRSEPSSATPRSTASARQPDRPMRPTEWAVPEPAPARRRSASRTSSDRRFRGAGSAELRLPDLVDQERRGRQTGRHGPRPGHLPGRLPSCFPCIRSRQVRLQVLKSCVSGTLLGLLLIIYLVLSITKSINSSEFTVVLILVVLFTTVFFCHGLVRLCMLMISLPEEEEEALRRREGRPAMQHQPAGAYAVPTRPIRVLLARDEQAAGIESEATKGLAPPAYGLWRESVRVDPNRIYWQRNEQHNPGLTAAVVGDMPHRMPQNRPPSYASDDGVRYVVEAAPRVTTLTR